MVGEEASFFALCDGETAIPLASAQDHKRVGDGDTGPEHRRHGRLFAGAGDDAGDDRADDGRDHRADHARDEGDGRAVQGRAVRRPDDHQGRAEADRIQRALRRSGNAGADAAADVGPGAGADRVARRPAQELRPALVSGRGADRGDGGERLSRRLRARLGDRRARRGGAGRRRRDFPRRHQGRRRQDPRQRRARAQRLGARQDRDARRRRAPIGRSTGSNGRRASAAATSAGRR